METGDGEAFLSLMGRLWALPDRLSFARLAFAQTGLELARAELAAAEAALPEPLSPAPQIGGAFLGTPTPPHIPVLWERIRDFTAAVEAVRRELRR